MADSGSEATAEINVGEVVDEIRTELREHRETVESAIGDLVKEGAALRETVERLQSVRFTLDPTTVAQLGAALREEFKKVGEELIEAQAQHVSARVVEKVGGDFFRRTKEAISQTAPPGSPLAKVAMVCSIVGGVVVAGMAVTYGYAVANYQPPRTEVTVDGATGGVEAHSSGGQPLS